MEPREYCSPNTMASHQLHLVKKSLNQKRIAWGRWRWWWRGVGRDDIIDSVWEPPSLLPPPSTISKTLHCSLLTLLVHFSCWCYHPGTAQCTHCDDDDDDHALQFANHQLVMKVLCTGELVLQLKNASIAFDTSGPPPINFPVMQAMSTWFIFSAGANKKSSLKGAKKIQHTSLLRIQSLGQCLYFCHITKQIDWMIIVWKLADVNTASMWIVVMMNTA